MTGLLLAAFLIYWGRKLICDYFGRGIMSTMGTLAPQTRAAFLQTLMNHWCPICGEPVTRDTECQRPHPNASKAQPEIN
jgi:hypothetical protein